MPLTLERLQAIQASIAAQAERPADPGEPEKKRGPKTKSIRAFGRWGGDRAIDYDKVNAAIRAESADETVEWTPRYLGGDYRFLPIMDNVRAMFRTRHLNDFKRLRTVCLTCGQYLGDAEQCNSRRRIFGAASDHARTTMNHLVVVVDDRKGDNQILWKSAYDVLGSCSE